MIRDILVIVFGLLAVFFLSGWTLRTERVIRGSLTFGGVLQEQIAGKTFTLGLAPVRANRLYFRLEVA